MRISDWSSYVCSSVLLGSIATLIADPVLVLLHDLCKLIFQCLGNGFLFEIVESDFLRSILRHGGCPGLADEVSQRRLARREDENLARRQRNDLLHQFGRCLHRLQRSLAPMIFDAFTPGKRLHFTQWFQWLQLLSKSIFKI